MEKIDLRKIFDLAKIDIEPGEFSDWHRLKSKLLLKKLKKEISEWESLSDESLKNFERELFKHQT